ncbi:MAG: patatin-like phospholipase family protein [Polyangiaceae bacterium]
MTSPEEARPSIGLVLSGGGARGAYEAGALGYIADELPALLDRVRVITGTSVGAVNAAYIASRGLSVSAVHELEDIWRTLVVDDLVSVDRGGLQELLAAGGKRLIGRPVRSPPVGLLRVDGIAKLVGEKADWKGLRKVVKSRRLDAVGVAATDIASGRTSFFVDYADELSPRWSRGGDASSVVRTGLGPAHVLASAAIPMIFPPVEVGGRWYMDGGVRCNTPLSPALGLGADRLLILSVRAAPEARLSAPEGGFSGFGQIVGKVLDSVFLDRIAFDLDRLERINDMVEILEESCGDALTKVHAALKLRDRPAYRAIRYCHIRPSRDLGALAAEHLAHLSGSGRVLSVARILKALFQDDEGTTGDAASFLLFDGEFCGSLIEAGRRDAAAQRTELEKLLA